jgi:hypothetical protein
LEPWYIFLGLAVFFIILMLLPNQDKKIRKEFKRKSSILSKDINNKIIKVQGKSILIEALTTPIFKNKAAFYETKFYEMYELAKGGGDLGTGFNSNESDWRLKETRSKKNSFLIQVKGDYALIDVEHCEFLITKNVDKFNNYGDLNEFILNGKLRYSDLEPNVLDFITSLGLTAKYYKYNDEAIIQLKESKIGEGAHVAVVGKCTVEDIQDYPLVKSILPSGIKNIFVIKGTSETPVYLTDDFGILFG